MSDMRAARGHIHAAMLAIRDDRGSYAVAALQSALGNMDRKYNKRTKRVGIRTNEGHRRQIRQMCDTGIVDDMTAVEIAQQVFGNACASGRVSEIIAKHRENGYARSAA